MTATTWDPTVDTGNIAYSNGNLTASIGTPGGFHYPISTDGKSSGLVLVENSGSGSSGTGTYLSSQDETVAIGVNLGTGAVFAAGGGFGGGHVLWGGVGGGVTAVTYALDFTNKMFWIYLNSAPGWRGAAFTTGADPTSGAGGIDMAPLVNYNPQAWFLGALAPGSAAAITASFAGPFIPATPAGYSAWSPSSIPVLQPSSLLL